MNLRIATSVGFRWNDGLGDLELMSVEGGFPSSLPESLAGDDEDMTMKDKDKRL